jgi:hypothetical protein
VPGCTRVIQLSSSPCSSGGGTCVEFVEGLLLILDCGPCFQFPHLCLSWSSTVLCTLAPLQALAFLSAALCIALGFVVLHLGLISVSRAYLFCASISSLLPCVLPACFSASTGLISDLAIISILSSYVPIMHHVTHFSLLYRHSHMYISFLLMTLYDSSLLYTSHVAHCSTY